MFPGRGGRTPRPLDSPTAADRWLRTLRGGAEDARALYEALQDFVAEPVRPATRLKILDRLGGPVASTCTDLELGVPDADPAVRAPAERAQAALAREFHLSMGAGYALVVSDTLEKTRIVPTLRRRAWLRAVGHALQYYSTALLKSYQLYMPVPEGVWRNLHQLYTHARSQRLLDRVIPGFEEGDTQATAKSLYSRALLFALSSPYRLDPDQTLLAYQLCDRLAQSCNIAASPRGRVAQTSVFGFDADSDEPPRAIASGAPKVSGQSFSIDASEPAARLARELEHMNPKQRELVIAEMPVPTQLARHLFRMWSSRAVRHSARSAAQHSLESVVGFDYVHFKVGHDLDFSQVLATLGPQLGLEYRLEDVADWFGGDETAPRPIVTRCRMLDQSLGGYRLRWTDADAVGARVGGVLALRDPTDPERGHRWLVGTFRWLHVHEDGQLEAGIEVIGRRVEALFAYFHRSFESRVPPQRAFILAGTDPDRRAYQHLVVPRIVAPWIGRLRLARLGGAGLLEPFDLKIRDLVERTQSYCRYECQWDEPLRSDPV